MTYEFLTLDDALEIHCDQLQVYGGREGVRDEGLLLSALAQPAVSMGGMFLHKDLFEMAATYLFHVVQNHPFIDGNKRTGFLTALIFLSLNGVDLELVEDEIDPMVFQVAEGKMDKHEITKWFKARS